MQSFSEIETVGPCDADERPRKLRGTAKLSRGHVPILTVQLGPPRIRPKQGFGGGFWGSALVANRDVGPSKRRRPSKGREKLAESREVAADAWQVKKLRAKGIKRAF